MIEILREVDALKRMTIVAVSKHITRNIMLTIVDNVDQCGISGSKCLSRLDDCLFCYFSSIFLVQTD